MAVYRLQYIAGSDSISDSLDVGAISIERQGSILDLNQPTNWGMGEQSKWSKPLSDDEENTVSQGAGITHQDDIDRKETFEEAYFGKYPNLFEPGYSKCEETLETGKYGQIISEEDDNTKQCHEPVVVVDHKTPHSREMDRKSLFQKRFSFEPSTKSSPGSNQHPRSRLEESNQPLDFSLTRDNNIPLGVDNMTIIFQ